MILLAASIPMQLLGQMFPLSNHYLYNTLVINPAYAGYHEALSTTISYRNQWIGFKDAPKSSALSIHAPIDNDRIGLGLLIEKSSIGIYKETSFIGNYAYRMQLHDGKLALGVGFGLTLYNIGWNELVVADANDLQLINNPTSATLPEFSAGLYYYTKKYFIGISVPSFLSHEWDENAYKIKNNFSNYNYFFTGGYEVEITSQVKIMPSLLIKYHPNNMIQIDYNAQINLKDKVWLALGYRNKNMLAGMIQCQLNYQLRMAYSYDFDIGTVGKYKNGSHELVLNYVFKYARKIMGPRQF